MKALKYFVIIACILLILPENTTSQTLDYEDDVYPVVKSQPKEISYPLLFNFQKQVPGHANAYFQLGMIFKEWTFEYDPFTDYYVVIYFANQAETYFGLSLSNIDKKEARKNGEYYQGAEKQKGNWWHKPEDIKNVIYDHRAELRRYKQNIMEQRNFLMNSVQKYDHCIKLFREINERYKTIKDIYLKADDAFLEKVSELEQTFDSSLIYLDFYKMALNQNPTKEYDPQYSLAEIKTYHLQGITDANFLSNEFVLWDFKTWVKELRKVLNNEITVLREKINEAEIDIEQNFRKARKHQLEDEYSLDRKLGFLISKYDYQSVILDLFNYKTAKINFLSNYNRPLNNSLLNTEPDQFRKKNIYFSNLTNHKIKSDSLLQHFNGNLSQDEFEKHKDFFNNNYNGLEGLDNYVAQQQTNNRELMDESYKNLLASMVNQKRFHLSDTLRTYNDKKMRLSRCASIDTNTVYGYKPASIKQYNNHYYMCGYLDDSVKTDQAFFAKTDTSMNVVWLKEFEQEEPLINRAVQFDMSKDTIVTLVHEIDTVENRSSNYVIKIDHWGNVLDKTKLNYTRKPRYLVYDDLNQTLLFAFQGLSIDTLQHELDTLKIVRTNTALDTTHWENHFEYKGNLVDIVKMDLNYLVFCNYSEYEDPLNENEETSTHTEAPSSSVAIQINDKGETKKVKNYSDSDPYFLVNAEKLNSEEINLQGIRGEYFNLLNQEINLADKKIYYTIVNEKGDVIIQNPE